MDIVKNQAKSSELRAEKLFQHIDKMRRKEREKEKMREEERRGKEEWKWVKK